MQYTAYRTKLKLNNGQATLMAKHAGYSRWVSNWGLRLWSDGYKSGLKPSASTLRKLFTNHVKRSFPWMDELSSKVYQYAFISVGEAFRRQLEYKTQRYGSQLVVVDRFFPSSQLCSKCGDRQKMPLKVRTFECEKCGNVKERDFNASLNLEYYPTAVGLTVNACGAGAADTPL